MVMPENQTAHWTAADLAKIQPKILFLAPERKATEQLEATGRKANGYPE